MRVFDYIYFKYYQFFKVLNDEMPEFIAMMAFCWTLLMNSTTIMVGVGVLFEWDILTVFSNRLLGLGVSIGILLLCYSRFSYKDQSDLIINRYQNESPKEHKQGIALALSYSVVSFWVCLKCVVPFLASLK